MIVDFDPSYAEHIHVVRFHSKVINNYPANLISLYNSYFKAHYEICHVTPMARSNIMNRG